MHSTAGKVNDGTYIAFMVLMFLGFLLAWCLVPTKDVIRSDGSKVILMKHPSWKSEIIGLYEVVRTDPKIILLFPMFFASNWFYTYHFQDVNLARFTIRTRALNSILYYSMQIVAAYIFGFTLDYSGVRRSVRAKASIIVLFVLTMVIWGGGYDYQKQYTRGEVSAKSYVKMDFKDSGYIGPMFL